MKPKRNASLDALRIIFMLTITTMHYFTLQDMTLRAGAEPEIVRYFGTFLQSFSVVGLNGWILLSGYFQYPSKLKIKSILALVLRLMFYSYLLYVAAGVFGWEGSLAGEGMIAKIQALFPLSSNHYWFMTSYATLIILSPVLNEGVRRLPHKQLKMVIGLMLLFYSLIKSFVPVHFATDDYGYGIKWFITVYLIGAYIRRCRDEQDSVPEQDAAFVSAKSRSKHLLIYVCSAAAMFLLICAAYAINLRTGRFGEYIAVPMHYNFIFQLTGSFGIFLFFLNLPLEEGFVAKCCTFLAPYAVGVYLLQTHPAVFRNWLPMLERFLGEASRTSIPALMLHLVICNILMCICGVVLDFVCSKLVKGILTLFDGAGKK